MLSYKGAPYLEVILVSLYGQGQEGLCVGEVRDSCKLSVKVWKAWFESQRTHYGKSKSGQAPKGMTGQNWIQDKFNFLKTHFRCKGLSKSSHFKSPAQAANSSTASVHNISNSFKQFQWTHIVWRS